MNMPITVRLATKADIKQSLSSRCTADFEPAYDRCGSDSVIRRCRLNVRFARKQTWQGDEGYQPERGRQVYHCPLLWTQRGGGRVTVPVGAFDSTPAAACCIEGALCYGFTKSSTTTSDP